MSEVTRPSEHSWYVHPKMSKISVHKTSPPVQAHGWWYSETWYRKTTIPCNIHCHQQINSFQWRLLPLTRHFWSLACRYVKVEQCFCCSAELFKHNQTPAGATSAVMTDCFCTSFYLDQEWNQAAQDRQAAALIEASKESSSPEISLPSGLCGLRCSATCWGSLCSPILLPPW